MSIPIVKMATTEAFPIGLRYVSPDLETGETIVTVTTAVEPVGLTLTGSPTISGAEVYQWITGGVSGIEYRLRFKVTISSGKIFNHPENDAIIVKVI